MEPSVLKINSEHRLEVYAEGEVPTKVVARTNNEVDGEPVLSATYIVSPEKKVIIESCGKVVVSIDSENETIEINGERNPQNVFMSIQSMMNLG